jgi:glucose/arabinose dehydrogenase
LAYKLFVFILTFCSSIVFAQTSINFQQIASGLTRPVAITNAGDGSGRLFITLQGGQIVIYDGTQVLSTPFLDISSLVTCCGEQGLLSAAFHPNYQSNGFFYVYYTQPNGLLTIARYKVSANPNVADPTSALIILTIPHPNASNHNGGQLQFGPDGYLYMGTGDGGGGGDPDENGQNLNALLGKILRLDVNAAPPYIPPSNPFVDGNPNTRDEIWAFGVRNPWRFSFDRQTGDIFIGDVGQGCYEEVDFQPASSNGGENYGWDVMEGRKCYDEPSGSNCNLPPTCVQPQFILPIIVYNHSGTNHCAVTGGYRYRGPLSPSLTGVYIYGDYCSGIIWGATDDGNGNWTSTQLADSGYSISTFGEDENGEIYVADLSTGNVYRIATASGLPFTDDFEDGDASDWTPNNNGTWVVNTGNLEGTTNKKSTDLAPFGGCSSCTVEADLRIVTAGGRVSLIGWWINKANYVELILKDDKDKIVFKQRSGGSTVAKTSIDQVLDPGVDYHVKITYDGVQFQVFLNQGATPIVTVNSQALSIGTFGFRVKSTTKANTTGSFREISIY